VDAKLSAKRRRHDSLHVLLVSVQCLTINVVYKCTLLQGSPDSAHSIYGESLREVQLRLVCIQCQ
jgi:hypothetical protein